ncbi:MAG: glycosyltransferase [Acidobacteriota bacterium]|nr:glycosyltransferase [Acidobacteriota bacterium]
MSESVEQKPPVVTVAITCYNQAHFLGEAIESVRRQSYPHHEIVVVDDGSPRDDPAAVAARFPEVKFIRQENQGVSAARNRAWRESGGAFVIFLDADDRLLPRALRDGVDAFASHPECAFVFGHAARIDAAGSPAAGEPAWVKNGDDYYAAMLRHNYIWMPAMVMHRRSVLAETGGFDTSADHSGDFEFHLRVTRNYPVHYHGHTVAEYRMHGTQTSHKADLMLKNTLAVYRAQQEYIRGSRQRRKAHQEGLKFFRHLYGEQLVGTLRTQLRTPGERQRAAEGALLLLRHCPKVFMYHFYRKLYCTVFRIKEQEQ